VRSRGKHRRCSCGILSQIEAARVVVGLLWRVGWLEGVAFLRRIPCDVFLTRTTLVTTETYYSVLLVQHMFFEDSLIDLILSLVYEVIHSETALRRKTSLILLVSQACTGSSDPQVILLASL
jgi:hypothetical protein